MKHLQKKKIVIVGAGPGGLAGALLLSSKGYDVTVFEKQASVGGRNGKFEIDGFRFDIGPTFLSMVQIAEEIFEESGKKLSDYLDLVELDPMYQLVFPHVSIDMSRNQTKMVQQIEKKFPGNGNGYRRFMKEQKKRMDALMPVLQNRFDSIFNYIHPQFVQALPQLSVTKNLYEVLSQYFDDEYLKLAFTFQSKYLGMSPWECPGAFSILSYMEHAYGVFHPIGGLNQLSEAMAKAAIENSATIHTDCAVKQLLIRNGETIGVELENGEKIDSDFVVVNADFAQAMTKLVPKTFPLKKYNEHKLLKKKYSCSTFMIYLGLDMVYENLRHHTILFSDDYAKNVDEITHQLVLSEDPSIYIQNAVVTDKTVAPPGKSTLYILAPVPNNFSNIPWNEAKELFKERVYEQVENKLGLSDLKKHILFEKVFTPLDWEQQLDVYQGATFNLGHQLMQMMYFRPHNQFEEIENCYLVGGGTHPGSGLPTILQSAIITTRLIEEKNQQTRREAK